MDEVVMTLGANLSRGPCGFNADCRRGRKARVVAGVCFVRLSFGSGDPGVAHEHVDVGLLLRKLVDDPLEVFFLGDVAGTEGDDGAAAFSGRVVGLGGFLESFYAAPHDAGEDQSDDHDQRASRISAFRGEDAISSLIMLCHPAILLAEIRQLPRAYSRACAGTTGVALGLYVSFASVMTARASYLPLVAEMAGRTWILCCEKYESTPMKAETPSESSKDGSADKALAPDSRTAGMILAAA
ncbi:hypothetical protein KC347_g172 [Hortaea werneckii]|nr:hypothetical protein KC347_g172 [Hortaea werneckii]